MQHQRAKLFTLVCCLAITNSVQSASWFLSQGAVAGVNSGVDWNNAWTNATSVKLGVGYIVPGDTLYIAGPYDYTNDAAQYGFSNYSYITITAGKGGTINQAVTFQRARATNSDCSSAAGWNPSFDSRPALHGFYFPSSNETQEPTNIVIDGVIPFVGMLITNAEDYMTSATYGLAFDEGGSYITLKNCEVAGYARVGITNKAECRLWHTGTSHISLSNHIHHCYLHNAPTLLSTSTEVGLIVEDCFLANSLAGDESGGGTHCNVWIVAGCTNVIFRNSIISNYATLGCMFTSTCTSNFQVYGTLWIVGPEGAGAASTSVIAPQVGTQGPFAFYNNTVIGPYWCFTGFSATWAPGCSVSNNIIFTTAPYSTDNCGVDSITGQINADYNLSGKPIAGAHSITNASIASVFSDTNSYAIVSSVGNSLARDKGVNLGSVYSVDANGVTRGSDGAWDIGAYEIYTTPNVNTPTSIPPMGMLMR